MSEVVIPGKIPLTDFVSTPARMLGSFCKNKSHGDASVMRDHFLQDPCNFQCLGFIDLHARKKHHGLGLVRFPNTWTKHHSEHDFVGKMLILLHARAHKAAKSCRIPPSI